MEKRKVYNKVYRNPKVFSQRKKIRTGKISIFLKKVVIFLIIIIISFLIIYLFKSDYLKIKNIKISGDGEFQQKVDTYIKEELQRNKLFIFNNDNIILFNSREAENNIQKRIKEIKSISITKKIPNAIEVIFRCKKASIVWETKDKKYLIDGEGFVIKEIDNNNDLITIKDESNLPIGNDDRVVYPNFVSFVENLTNRLKGLSINIDYISIKETTFILNIHTKESISLILDTTKSLDDQINKLSETLKQLESKKNNIEYIDLTIKNKTIYKLK
ncbi:hypothetical protein COX95_02320 [bacterium CG_4_10_14_0_2_um_filter_33_32]|nr:MAG: hypothetical protein AUJ93_04610 [bacterium CG2_30_33_46]PIR67659.1 MAG: hypothetical protein COU50_02050 [bacterium CG10_big_fil_rev_8_21_14_0_10_33_18]PIU76495.1 MAG: hypothetical protein COS74_03675 [bacterium CG06_land_8_20_14_3_00_33_50]PIW80940.1 MAG: hypothetical protein COZ97_04315 [bacterium CG_4_8_14_3_um_filter_33_28]PIY85209.1 MAG: hypothetical protein COY76_03355 [bacterium CG_4_10_14_0_8_um_filter_33_57]PIZ86072.1 MAG: hypothetical protein COX95_02320 [bacterium CG_4_10_1